jgi:hypothetical protein
MAKKKLTDYELEMDGYQALYAAATPSADFKKLVDECVRFIDHNGKLHFTEEPLSDDECRARGWRKDIEYMNYELDEEVYKEIVESKIKEHKLKGYKAQAFRNTMYLGSGPTFTKKD